MKHKPIKELRQVAGNTDELLYHLIKIVEENDDRFSLEWSLGGEQAAMGIFDKEKEIGYAVKIDPIKYDKKWKPRILW